jgi:ubiquinone/menaquinone biosynthesis C-methylase UbiE
LGIEHKGSKAVATFKALEQSGWTEKAAAYDQHFAGITDQAIGPMLEAAGDLKDRNVLDIGCGTGNLAATALARGARVTGIDFAPTMIELAKTKIAGVDFRVGDAEALDASDDSFDVALCAFGVKHMPEPERAIAEAARVLKQGEYLSIQPGARPSMVGICSPSL